MDKQRYELLLEIRSGPRERVEPVIDCALDIDNLLWHADVSGHFDPYTLVLTDIASGAVLPSQWKDGQFSMILKGQLAADAGRTLSLAFDVLPPDVQATAPPKNDFTDRVVVLDMGQELLFAKNERELCRYKHGDPWKPYFFPIYGPDGHVVRDRVYNAEGHFFHHGLWVAYGSMDHNSVNLWCESDQIKPRRGPTGRIVHEAFEQFSFGWVYAWVRERLRYCKPDGTPFARELRTLRVFAPNDDVQIIDWGIRLTEPEDTGRRGMMFACRVAPSMRLEDKSRGWKQTVPMENPGKIEQGETHPWVDYSGPVGPSGEGWNGIALFDHPTNPGYPIWAKAQGYGLMNFSREYPQDDDSRGGAVQLRYRAYIHNGDASKGYVEQAWYDYVHPCRVIPGEIRPVEGKD